MIDFSAFLGGFCHRPNCCSPLILLAINSHFCCVQKRENPMNQDQIKGKWNQLKGEIKTKWAKMTDDDLLEVEGDIDKLAGTIQERTGDRKEDIRKWLKERGH
jgi:uncharacterized protein YjbJ (UPF0337 family)